MNFSLKEQDFIKLFCYSSFPPVRESSVKSFSSSTRFYSQLQAPGQQPFLSLYGELQNLLIAF